MFEIGDIGRHSYRGEWYEQEKGDRSWFPLYVLDVRASWAIDSATIS